MNTAQTVYICVIRGPVFSSRNYLSSCTRWRLERVRTTDA